MRVALTGVLVAGLLLAAGATGQSADLDREQLASWLEGYGAAWESRDPGAAAALFTPAASYFETPYAEPFDGRNGIAEYWRNVTADQREIEFTYEVLAVDGNTGVAEWHATFVSASTGATVGLDGIFVLRFDAEGLCSELREWWFLRPMAEEPAAP